MELQKQKEIREMARLVAAEIIVQLQQYEIRHTEFGNSGEIVKGYYSIEAGGSSFDYEIALRRNRQREWQEEHARRAVDSFFTK